MSYTNKPVTKTLLKFAHLLVNQEKAKIIVPAQKDSNGYWFGGGKMIEVDGVLYISGRYRNFGDSRTGTGMGERGLELAIFASKNKGESWEKVKSFSKSDLNVEGVQVLSIEGTALHKNGDKIELFISTEKSGIPYPPTVEKFLKPGTGVWTIDYIKADSVEELTTSNIKTLIRGDNPDFINVKDPFVYDTTTGETCLFFATHPFSWSSDNTAYFMRKKGEEKFSTGSWLPFGRGMSWDIAIRRATSILPIEVSANNKISLVFYDGGECMRNLAEHDQAVKRPRGYSCEELGGVGIIENDNFESFVSITPYLPEFISPYGTGCSRYVDVLQTEDGYYATWQQSQQDLSQPLVMNFITKEEAEKVLKFME